MVDCWRDVMPEAVSEQEADFLEQQLKLLPGARVLQGNTTWPLFKKSGQVNFVTSYEHKTYGLTRTRDDTLQKWPSCLVSGLSRPRFWRSSRTGDEDGRSLWSGRRQASRARSASPTGYPRH